MSENIKKKIEKSIENALKELDIAIEKPIGIEHPEDMSHGDYSSNVALVYSKDIKTSPKVLAEKIIENINTDKPDEVLKIEVAGPGFINFFLKDEYFMKQILKIDKDFGKNKLDHGKEIMVEYTDPNPFKIFHIGHLMTNAIGESIGRLVEFSGAKVIRACYQGDVGLHVAKTIFAWKFLDENTGKSNLDEWKTLDEKIKFIGNMYVMGDAVFNLKDAFGNIEGLPSKEDMKKEIVEINKKIFDRSDKEVNKIYDAGRKFSLEYFDKIYKKLDTKFDNFFFESEVASDGVKIVLKFLEKGIFEKSDGAIIFPGEKYGEHTRVFINSYGLPTYEAKELGLTLKKFELYPKLDESIVVSANEINAYFKVIISVMDKINPDIAKKMKHIGHGILRPSTGKMSSRKGNIVAAEELIEEFKGLVKEKIKDREFETSERENLLDIISIAGIKYMILRQASGGDVVYDPEKAVSFEGDSGPYLQYSTVRARSVVNKAPKVLKVNKNPESVGQLEKLLVRFEEVVTRSRIEYSPHYITTYLTELAGTFNSYYANNKIIDDSDPVSNYRVALTKSFVNVMENGLYLLGIKVPEKM